MVCELRYVKKKSDCTEAFYTLMPSQAEHHLGAEGFLHPVKPESDQIAAGLFVVNPEATSVWDGDRILQELAKAISGEDIILKWVDPFGYVILIRRVLKPGKTADQTIEIV